MKELVSVYCSNQVNKKNVKMTVGALVGAVKDSLDGLPMYFGHNHHRPIGWTSPLGVFIEPKLVRALGTATLPENQKENEIIIKKIKSHLYKNLPSDLNVYVKILDKELSELYSTDKLYSTTECVSVIDTGIVKRKFPELFDKEDKSGLISLKLLKPIDPGVYQFGDFILFAHSYFRRSLSRLNTLNEEFLSRLEHANQNPELDVKISLDLDLIGLAQTYNKRYEFQYWRGPIFNNNLSEIPEGVTVYEANENQTLFSGMSRIEFGWYTQDSKRTLECEEIANEPSYGLNNESFGCRYVHSMLDENTKTPYHLDGAIRLYNEEKMIDRLDVDIKRAPRDTIYTKLWRIDGNISIDLWKSLIVDFYRDNTLVTEYFEGKKVFDTDITPSIIAAQDSENFIPLKLNKGSGVRVLVSLHPHKKSLDKNVLYNSERLILDKHSYEVMDANTLTLLKMLKKGISINYNHDVNFIDYNDLITNFPPIIFSSENAVKDAIFTKKQIYKLCLAWDKRSDNRIITFTIGINYKENLVYFSYLSHISDLVKWMRIDKTEYPLTVNEINKWAEKISTTLNATFHREDIFNLSSILKPDNGTLYINRKEISKDKIVAFSSNKNGLDIQLKLTPSELEVLEANGIEATVPIWIKNSDCSKCNQEYKSCNCIKTIDSNVYENVTQMHFLSPIWTDRKA